MQLQARASSPGVDSNPTIPDAAHIAHDVLAALTPPQEQMILEQQRLEEQIANMMVIQRETLDSQRIAFTTEVRRMRTEIQESIRSTNPAEQPQTSWSANSPAYIQPPQMQPRQQVQPWDIPAGSPRAPSSPKGEAARDEGITRHPPNERANMEWNRIKAGMTARAWQKEDYDIQGNAFDSNATVLPGLRMGLSAEDAGRLDIHRTGSVRCTTLGQLEDSLVGHICRFHPCPVAGFLNITECNLVLIPMLPTGV